jgi:hypothetical protein
MGKVLFSRRSIIRSLVGAIILGGGMAAYAAGPQDPLPNGAKVLRSGSLTVTQNGQGSNLFVPNRSVLTVEFSIQSGKELKLVVLTNAMFEQISRGERPTGDALMARVISGVGSESITLERGTYVVFFGIRETGNAKVTYRVHYRIA